MAKYVKLNKITCFEYFRKIFMFFLSTYMTFSICPWKNETKKDMSPPTFLKDNNSF